MERGTKALLAGAGTAAAAVVKLTAGRRTGPDDTVVETITVLGPMDEVAAAWNEHAVDGVQVDFAPAPGDRGTEVRSRVVSNAVSEPELRETLRRFKATVEGGEVVTVDGQPSGRGPVAEGLTRAVTRRLRGWSGS